MNPPAIRIKCAEIVGWTYIEQLAYTGIPKGSRGSADARVIPNYTESADAALQLVEWMAKPENGGWWYESQGSTKHGFSFCKIGENRDAVADTIPLVICLAFLKANGIDPETL